MTCTRIGNIIVCRTPWARLHVGNRYIWMDFHEHCGPAFWYDQAGNKPYDPVDENDPVWPEFNKWFAKYQAAKESAARRK